ncbi:E3 ubiquitin-protein ligase APD2-like [Impatiens glandulifera]|uniref:E3 ubiquitin-protein ligase APD2-like n=1 Tax=Impatiens glandulifera TaxID=253017 RepID=UPI001FB0D419|nr:E3 ubiquitin-protein ligase APD2-like [Impatiens glandulifera]
MDDDDDNHTSPLLPSPPPNSIEEPSSSASQSQIYENAVGEDDTRRRPETSYRINITVFGGVSRRINDDVLSCLIVLVAFWFFASMFMIFGLYGTMNLQLGPNCSRMLQVNPFFVQTIRAEEIDDSRNGLMLYGFYDIPPLDTEVTWSETHNMLIPSNFHKDWAHFLNKGSEMNISYSVKSSSSIPLSLIIAEGRENLVEWMEDPSYPNTTLSWNIIQGNGIIHQKIQKSYMYYIAVGNLNSMEVEVQLNFTIKGIMYNTTNAFYKCSLSRRLCSYNLFIYGTNYALVTSPPIPQSLPYFDWYVKFAYGPRLITYITGSGMMTVIILLALRICGMLQIFTEEARGMQARDFISDRTPLILHKDDDLLSWGSSYDSISDEEEEEESLDIRRSVDDAQRTCVKCSDAEKNCFFLPCGHGVVCFSCGIRTKEEGGTCPICQREIKKVRKIFTV